MLEETIQNNGVEATEDQDVSYTDYIEAIKEMKRNSVSRSEYERLEAEKKSLVQALINGEEVKTEQAKPDVDTIRDKLFKDGGSMNNLEYVKTLCELRDAIMANGGDDPAVAVGRKVAPTREDYECAERTFEVYKDCIEYAQGDSQLFTNELMRRTQDASIPR